MLLAPLEVVGHALVGRQDLPIPEWLFAWAAALVLIVSFFGLSVAWHTSRFEESHWRPVRAWISSLLVNPVTEVLAGALGVFLLGLTVWSGLNGTEAPDRNFSVTFVFVTVWLGLVGLSVVFGDVFRAFNPWRAIARVVGGVFKLVAGQSAPPPLTYPERLGRWPAVVGIVAFVWLELVYGQGGFQTVGLTPHTVAVAALVYTAYTFVAMTLFGAEKWLERGETFSVYFGMFSTLAPLEVRERRLGVRRALSAADALGRRGAGLDRARPGDDRRDDLRRRRRGDAGRADPDGRRTGSATSGSAPVAALRVSNSIFLALTLGFVAGLFWAGIYGMHTVRTNFSTRRARASSSRTRSSRSRSPTWSPTTSASSSSRSRPSSPSCSPTRSATARTSSAPRPAASTTRAISANAIWYVQVAALVVGHVTALVLGHDRALKVYGDPQLATRSQYWMLALMVGFTSLGLFLLSQANA